MADTQKLLTALSQLDPTDDSQWTTSGLPKISTVEELSGEDTNRAEINSIADGFTQQNPTLGQFEVDTTTTIKTTVEVNNVEETEEPTPNVTETVNDTAQQIPQLPFAQQRMKDVQQFIETQQRLNIAKYKK